MTDEKRRMMPAPNSPGARLDEAMKDAGLNARQLAHLSGVSDSVISRLRRGERTEQKASTFEKLAATLGVSSGWLQGGREPKRSSVAPRRTKSLEQVLEDYQWPSDLKPDDAREVIRRIEAEQKPGPELPVSYLRVRLARIIGEVQGRISSDRPSEDDVT